MAVTIEWDVVHACGHDQTHDLSSKRVAERAGYARRLACMDCLTCRTTQKHRATSKARGALITQRRADEPTAIGVWEARTAKEGLDGSESGVELAGRVRHQLFTATHDTLELDGDAVTDQIEGPARNVKGASWWIDQRNTKPADLDELLADGVLDGLARTEANNQ